MKLESTGPRKFPRTLFLVIIVAIIAIGGVGSFYLFGTSHGSTTVAQNSPCSVLNSTQSAPGTANSSSTSLTANFTIIESDPGSNYEGMNGSAFHLSGNQTIPWPEIQVNQGQTVVIRIFNCASSESHGFAITHYFASGATVQPGQSYTLTFVANQPGTFRVFCSIFCAIHPYMQNGELIVTPS
jgi:heme/copper-type cytochrome/quinol oxidase subunit 2